MVMKDKIASVLIVEDEPDLQAVYKLILSSQGYRVTVANNGYEALKQIGKQTPDLILLDYFMPKMDGKTFLQNFDTGKYPGVKVVMSSNISDPVVIKEMNDLGIDRYVLKAELSPSQLVDLVEKVLS
jgi:CheY-like chemotaxis protein